MKLEKSNETTMKNKLLEISSEMKSNGLLGSDLSLILCLFKHICYVERRTRLR